MITRRSFLGSSAGYAAALFAAPSKGNAPAPELEKLGAVALDEAKKLNASYCDIRIVRYRRQNVSLRLTPEKPGGKPVEVPDLTDSDSFGFGVRVIADGAWGFAAAPAVNPAEIARVAREAVTVARANAALKRRPITLAPVKPYRDRWATPFKTNPFDVPPADKLGLIRAALAEMKKNAGVFSAYGYTGCYSEDKYFASSDGSSIQQFVVNVDGAITAVAVDFAKGGSKRRSYQAEPLTGGWEHIQAAGFLAQAGRVGAEAVEHLSAPPVSPGKKDLVLLPNHLWLTIHESLGHSTELDRALGYEANFAGTSFLKLDEKGKERIGSDLVTAYGDKTIEGGLATVRYDDDGVRTVRFPIVENGVFKHYQTTREMAPLCGEAESNGCSYADAWSHVPFQRMPNVWLAPGKPGTTLDDLVSGVDDGILIDGNGSYSIDQQRYNFQFGGDAFWEIRGGKKRGMISRVAYQSRTTDFWRACDGIAGQRFWMQYGAMNDGKGEPMQLNAVSHGCAPSRFRQINVIQTD